MGEVIGAPSPPELLAEHHAVADFSSECVKKLSLGEERDCNPLIFQG